MNFCSPNEKDGGRSHEASRLLSKTYDAFTEGLDTQDLRDAKALLDSF
jgi:hypothetical protein